MSNFHGLGYTKEKACNACKSKGWGCNSEIAVKLGDEGFCKRESFKKDLLLVFA